MLRLMRRPVGWDTFDVVDDDDRAVRVYFMQSAGGRGHGQPNHDIAEVAVVESSDVVAITLVERVVSGTYPDGADAVETLAAVCRCLELGLANSLGARRLIDGSTGNTARRLRRSGGGGGDDDDSLYVGVEERGCPRWTP